MIDFEPKKKIKINVKVERI